MVAVLAFLKQLETSKVMGKHHQTNIPGTMFLFFGGWLLEAPENVPVRRACTHVMYIHVQ